MPLFVSAHPFLKTLGCATALIVLTTCGAARVQADDFRLHDVRLSCNLDDKSSDNNSSLNSDSGKSGSDSGKKVSDSKPSHETVDFSFNQCDRSSDEFCFSDWAKGWEHGRGHYEFFVFVSDKSHDWGHDGDGHNSGGSSYGNTPPDQSGWNWGSCGNPCGGSNPGDPNGGGGLSSTPEPSGKLLSFIAAGLMALMLVGRGLRRNAGEPRGGLSLS